MNSKNRRLIVWTFVIALIAYNLVEMFWPVLFPKTKIKVTNHSGQILTEFIAEMPEETVVFPPIAENESFTITIKRRWPSAEFDLHQEGRLSEGTEIIPFKFLRSAGVPYDFIEYRVTESGDLGVTFSMGNRGEPPEGFVPIPYDKVNK